MIEQESFTDTEDWIERQLEEVYNLSYAIPLTLLHNITTLELVNCSEFLQRLDCHIWNDHNVFAGMQASHHQLQEIRLFGDYDQYDEVLEGLASFVDIPSVRRLYGLHVTGQHHDDDRLFVSFSHITGLHFECSSTGSSFLENLLRSVEALEDFYYEHSHVLNDMVIYYGQSVICNLRKHTRKTLQTLTYVDVDCKPVRDDVCDSFFLPSLHDFAVLRHAVIGYAIFGVDLDQNRRDECKELGIEFPATLIFDHTR